MGDQNNKNLILAMVLSMLVITVWMFLFPPPEATTDPDAPVTATDAMTSTTVDVNDPSIAATFSVL